MKLGRVYCLQGIPGVFIYPEMGNNTPVFIFSKVVKYTPLG